MNNTMTEIKNTVDGIKSRITEAEEWISELEDRMMKTQRNTAQMKEKGRNSQDRINKDEISNLPEREFRIMVIKMLQRLENTIEKMQETFNTVNRITKDKEEIKNKQTQMNNTITEIKKYCRRNQ